MLKLMHRACAAAMCSWFVLGFADAAAAQAAGTPEQSNGLHAAVAAAGIESQGMERIRWHRRSLEAAVRVQPAPHLRQAAVVKRRSRKKAVLIGAAMGATAGFGGGVYASYATGGDADLRVVGPAFAGLGAAVGAACGFLVSVF